MTGAIDVDQHRCNDQIQFENKFSQYDLTQKT